MTWLGIIDLNHRNITTK